MGWRGMGWRGMGWKWVKQEPFGNEMKYLINDIYINNINIYNKLFKIYVYLLKQNALGCFT